MPGEEAEIFTDVDSRVAKYKRVLRILLVVAPITVLLLLLAVWERDIPGIALIFLVLGSVLLVLYIIAFVKLVQKINRIKKLRE